jgi:hypothetical protein
MIHRNTPDSIAGLRARRNPPERNQGISPAVGELVASVVRQHRQVGGAGAAWAQVVPPELVACTELKQLSRGTLQVRVTDASARFAVDRFLRSGGERSLVSASGGKIKRVRLI